MTTLDQIVRYRATALLVYAFSFAIWQSTQLETARVQLGLGYMELLAPPFILLWLASTAFLIWQSRKYGRRSGGDELSRTNKARALAAGYWSVTLVAAAGLVAGASLPLPPADVLRVLLVVAVAVPALTYFHLERSGDCTQ